MYSWRGASCSVWKKIVLEYVCALQIVYMTVIVVRLKEKRKVMVGEGRRKMQK